MNLCDDNDASQEMAHSMLDMELETISRNESIGVSEKSGNQNRYVYGQKFDEISEGSNQIRHYDHEESKEEDE